MMLFCEAWVEIDEDILLSRRPISMQPRSYVRRKDVTIFFFDEAQEKDKHGTNPNMMKQATQHTHLCGTLRIILIITDSTALLLLLLTI